MPFVKYIIKLLIKSVQELLSNYPYLWLYRNVKLIYLSQKLKIWIKDVWLNRSILINIIRFYRLSRSTKYVLSSENHFGLSTLQLAHQKCREKKTRILPSWVKGCIRKITIIFTNWRVNYHNWRWRKVGGKVVSTFLKYKTCLT